MPPLKGRPGRNQYAPYQSTKDQNQRRHSRHIHPTVKRRFQAESPLPPPPPLQLQLRRDLNLNLNVTRSPVAGCRAVALATDPNTPVPISSPTAISMSGFAPSGYFSAVNTTSDADLLNAFSQGRSESAFDALVRRHLDLVHSAAFRLTGDAHLAHDVAQAVFVALAQHAAEVAGKVSRGNPLSAWLHVATRNLAAKLIRTESRRRARERESVAMNDQPPLDARHDATHDADWDRIAPHLDDGLAKLSPGDRNVVLLRFFERRSAREIGESLGIGEEAAQKRIRRAMDRLRTLLIRHTPEITTPILTALISAFTVKQAPSALAATITQTALNGAWVATPTAIQTWLTQVTSNLLMTKTQTAITVVLAAVVAIPLGVQQMQLQRIRAERLDDATLATFETAVPRGEIFAQPDQGTDTQAAEIARLRARLDDLRAQIASKPKPAATPRSVPPAQGPLLLLRGQPVPITNLVVAGNATPEAAAQSLLAFMRDGNLEATMGLWLLSPKNRAEWEDEVVHQPERREEVTRKMVSEVSNLLTVELVEVQPITEGRSRLVLRRISATETNGMTLTFGLNPSGWKQIP